MHRRMLFIIGTLCLVFGMALPALAQQGVFNDGRLDENPAAPIVVFCRFDNGLEAFDATTGGSALNVSRIQIEGGLAQAILDETPVQVAIGIRDARLTVFPDGGVLITAANNYRLNITSSDCGGYQPDYSLVVRLVADLITLVDAEVDSSGRLTTTSQTASGKTHTVRAGENLYRIGLRYGVHYTEIARVNGIGNVNSIFAGQVLTIP